MFISRIFLSFFKGFVYASLQTFLLILFQLKQKFIQMQGMCAQRCHGAVVPCSVWKALSQLQGSLPALCSTGPREQGVKRTDQNLACWDAAQKETHSFYSPLESFTAFTSFLSSPLLLLFAPRLERLRSQATPLECGYVCFLGKRQISGLASVQRKRGLMMLIHREICAPI